MNKDINKTLMALVPILKMNGENVTNIEAVHDWYKVGDREYMKEVAEITYDNGTVRYADIGCDSNLTAIYDVIAVIQQIKPRSKAIERIERGVYSLPSAEPEQRWIPCDKGEPDEDMECWVTVKTTDALYRGNFTKRYGERRDKGFITSVGFMRWNTALAWMPIYAPEPYKGDDK